MSILKSKIRAWWIEKHISHNMPTDVVFEEFKPTIMNGPNREWIKVISLDDFHKEAGMNITRWVEVCNELSVANKKLSIQEKRIKNLLKAVEFYASKSSWRDLIAEEGGPSCLIPEGVYDCIIAEDLSVNEEFGGEKARQCQAKDQELLKELEAIK